MSNSDEVASAGDGPTSRSLSEAQLSAFWNRVLANREAARRIAARYVSRQSIDDVVDTAAVNFVESLQGPKPSPFPATDDDFRHLFLTCVQRHACDCVRDSKVGKRPIHSHWAEAPEPIVKGHNVADRELDRVFARNDLGEYDAPAPTRRTEGDIQQLDWILDDHLSDLPPQQRRVVQEKFFEERKRAVVAARLGISVNTYDNHLRAALQSLRQSLTVDAEVSMGIERPSWYDLVEELCERRAVARLRRAPTKKGKRSNIEGKRGNSEGERSNSEGERSNVAHERSNVAHERSNVAHERSNVAHERSNVAHERGDDSRAGAA